MNFRVSSNGRSHITLMGSSPPPMKMWCADHAELARREQMELRFSRERRAKAERKRRRRLLRNAKYDAAFTEVDGQLPLIEWIGALGKTKE